MVKGLEYVFNFLDFAVSSHSIVDGRFRRLRTFAVQNP